MGKGLIIRIQNFQSILDETFVFESLTSIIGPTDRGKSAIFRALMSIFYNEWEEGFLRRGTKRCIITATFPERYSVSQVIQIKGKKNKENSYTIKFRDGKEDKYYPKIGVKVPEELKTMGFEIIETERKDKFNLNFHEQYDPLFLVAQSEPLVTSFFNNVFKITKYEGALKKLTSDNIKLNREYEDNNKELENKQETLKITQEEHSIISEGIVTFNKIIEGYDRCEGEIKGYEEGIIKLNQLCYVKRELVDIQNNHIREVETFDVLGKYLNSFIEYGFLMTNILNLVDLNFELGYLFTEMGNLNSKIGVFSNYLDSYIQYADLSVKINNKVELSNEIEKMIGFESNNLELKQVFDSYYSKYQNCLTIFKSYETMFKLESEIQILEKDLSQVDGIFSILVSILGCKNDLESLYTYSDGFIKSKCILDSYSINMEVANKELSKLTEYEGFVKSIIKTCPLCQSVLNEGHSHKSLGGN